MMAPKGEQLSLRAPYFDCSCAAQGREVNFCRQYFQQVLLEQLISILAGRHGPGRCAYFHSLLPSSEVSNTVPVVKNLLDIVRAIDMRRT
jgi:hypothetical protein